MDNCSPQPQRFFQIYKQKYTHTHTHTSKPVKEGAEPNMSKQTARTPQGSTHLLCHSGQWERFICLFRGLQITGSPKQHIWSVSAVCVGVGVRPEREREPVNTIKPLQKFSPLQSIDWLTAHTVDGVGLNWESSNASSPHSIELDRQVYNRGRYKT